MPGACSPKFGERGPSCGPFTRPASAPGLPHGPWPVSSPRAVAQSRVFYFYIFYFFKIYILFFLQIWPPIASSIGGKSLPLDEPAVGAL